jgi:hypothetical protein
MYTYLSIYLPTYLYLVTSNGNDESKDGITYELYAVILFSQARAPGTAAPPGRGAAPVRR